MKKSIAIIVVVLLLGGGYAVLGYAGIIQSPLSTAPVYPKNTMEINLKEVAVSFLSDEMYSDVVIAIDELDVETYGITEETGENITEWYNTENEKNGWEPLEQEKTWSYQTFVGYEIYTRAWYRYLKGQSLIVIGGEKIKTLTGYDVIVITSSAPLSEYQKYFT